MRSLNHCRVVGSAILVAGALALIQGCDTKPPPGKGVDLKILLPLEDADAKLLVDDRVFPGKGAERTIHATVRPDKENVVVAAAWEPNNYTKITRKRKVDWTAGTITVDLRNPSDVKGEKDDIVVRWVPTPLEVAAAMCKLGRVTPNDVVYDLGCGDGIMVLTAVEKFSAKRGVGVDLDKELVQKCKTKASSAGIADKVDFRVGDVLNVEDMSDATVVLLYMGDDINNRLKPILQKTLKPGSRVISHRFTMGDDWPPDKTEKMEVDGRSFEIHLWEIKGAN
ncbi:MAG TPA: methyltransferase domain-containing protein [Gemmataceae bacterium]|nr:methyltransferase domain-containing protein [Gemmataceae bacterium]